MTDEGDRYGMRFEGPWRWLAWVLIVAGIAGALIIAISVLVVPKADAESQSSVSYGWTSY